MLSDNYAIMDDERVRCPNCRKLLFILKSKGDGVHAEIKCPRCGKIVVVQ